MSQIKTTTTDYLFQSTLYLISALCCTLLLLFLHFLFGCLGAPTILWWRRGSRLHQDTQGWRLSLALPPFPPQIGFGCYDNRTVSISEQKKRKFKKTKKPCGARAGAARARTTGPRKEFHAIILSQLFRS